MRRNTSLSLVVVVCAAMAAWSFAASDSPEESLPVPVEQPAQAPAAKAPEAAEVGGTCEQLPALGPGDELTLMNSENGPADPQEAQIQCVRCNCTKPGTSIPPGQLGILCASPIGGSALKCRSHCCYTLISTPWINGVCR